MNSSPYGAPLADDIFYHEYFSPNATPSPRGLNGATVFCYPTNAATPAAAATSRPATRAAFGGHSRNNSSNNDYSTRSPRCTSNGHYATNTPIVSGSSRKPLSPSTQSPSPCPPRWSYSRDVHTATTTAPPRRNSFVFVRDRTPQDESDDEIIEVNGRTYILPADSRRHRSATSIGMRQQRPIIHNNTPLSSSSSPYHEAVADSGADRYYKQSGPAYVDARDARDAAAYDSAAPRPRDSTATPRPQPSRRASISMPRSHTARPASSHGIKKPSTSAAAAASSTSSSSAKAAKATEQDAMKHRIPAGYSLKNWDPTESPILLLGSVFDANSLGKWIYDWAVYTYGPTDSISVIAGELWLLLIQLAGKIRRADDVLAKVRTQDNKDTIIEYLESGERLMDRLRRLLKTCEEPMLKSAKKNAQLGKSAGIEFVETFFGPDRVLDKTKRFMESVSIFNLRFDANCDEIIKNPTI